MLDLKAIPISELPLGLLWHLVVLVVAALMVSVLHRIDPAAVRRAWRWSGRWARRPRLAMGTTALISLSLAAIPLLVNGPPVPRVHDEFANLLAADTFAKFELTNPSHPLREHFETMHVLSRPTYQAKYPPARAFGLTAGKLLVNQPAFGVWLATGLSTVAICWMLYGWLPSRWAFYGGLMTAVHAGFVLDWGLSFNGEQVATTGGALLLGSLPRLRRSCQPWTALALGVGLAVLANSRPAEGFVLAAVVMVILAWWVMQQESLTVGSVVVRLVLPLAFILLPTAVAMAHYNKEVTGNYLRLPYQVHTQQYMYSPLFFWQSAERPAHYGAKAIEDFYAGWEFRQYQSQTTPTGWLRGRAKRLLRASLFYLPPVLLLACIALPSALRRRKARVAMLPVLILMALMTVAWVWFSPRYLAPCAAAFMLLMMLAMRQLRWLKVGSFPLGKWLVRSIILSHGTVSLLILLGIVFQNESQGWHLDRANIERDLGRSGGEHIILVRYAEKHNPHHEWVYNAAEIDAADVIWSRSLGTERDQRLRDYFHDRSIWYLDADVQPPRLLPAF